MYKEAARATVRHILHALVQLLCVITLRWEKYSKKEKLKAKVADCFFSDSFLSITEDDKKYFSAACYAISISTPILAFTLICPCSITTIERKSARATG
jgi:hypothetical protein